MRTLLVLSFFVGIGATGCEYCSQCEARDLNGNIIASEEVCARNRNDLELEEWDLEDDYFDYNTSCRDK